MPRKVSRDTALRRAVVAQDRYLLSQKLLAQDIKRRKQAMLVCVEAGCSMTETGAIFDVGRTAVGNVVKELTERD